MKFCVNCKFYVHWESVAGECDKTKAPDPVTGQIVRKPCSEVRTDPARCGMEATWFEPKDNVRGAVP